jgi:rhamnose transport system ATP-binding protein
MTARLAIRGLSKSFGGIHALSDVGFEVQPGRVHAVLGENGAGKSTLVKIVTGIIAADSGEILLDGEPVRFASPMDARGKGVIAVYQDPKLFPHLDVAENVFMGLHPVTALGTIDRPRMLDRTRALLAELDAPIDPSAAVASLSISEAQFVEFARALAGGVDRVLILDEPTASLSPAETERLFRIVRRLRERGVSVILISHRLEELRDLVDTVTVLRDGRHVATRPAAELSEPDVVRLMVGRALEGDRPDGQPHALGPERLRVERLGLAGVFENVSFSLRTGEVVAMAGLVGAGRSEVAQTIFGITPATAGQIFVDGEPVQPRSPRDMLARGVAYLPEDRDGEGLVPAMAVRHNLVMSVLGRIARLGFLNRRREKDLAAKYTRDLQIKAATVEQAVASLSGGNRQKVVLGKWLAMGPKVLILDEPTHGIDVGTKAQVHDIVRSLARKGLAILLISSDLPEVLRMGDRVLVLAHGRLAAEFARDEAGEEEIMAAATRRLAA